MGKRRRPLARTLREQAGVSIVQNTRRRPERHRTAGRWTDQHYGVQQSSGCCGIARTGEYLQKQERPGCKSDRREAYAAHCELQHTILLSLSTYHPEDGPPRSGVSSAWQAEGSSEYYVVYPEDEETREAVVEDTRRQGTFSDRSNADVWLVFQQFGSLVVAISLPFGQVRTTSYSWRRQLVSRPPSRNC